MVRSLLFFGVRHGEQEMRQLRDVGFVVGMVGLLVSCASVSGTGGDLRHTVTPRPGALKTVVGSLTPASTPMPTDATVGSPIAAVASPSGLVTSPTTLPTPIPTIFETPTITPTPGPPTATPTPAPDPATVSAAQDVDAALVAFAEAAAKGDPNATLQAQRKLLEATASAVSVASADPSQYGKQLQSALDQISSASTGSYDQMASAHKSLATLAGAGAVVAGQGTPFAELPRPAAQSSASLPDAASALQRAVDNFNKASANGNEGDLLRAQRDLVTAVNAADAASKNNSSPLGQQLGRAVTLVHDGLGGDAGKFRDAAAALGQLSGQSASSSATATTGLRVDLQPLQNDLDNKLQLLQSALQGTDHSAVQKSEDDLRQSIQKASDATAGDQSPAAARFRDALGHATEAAGGDTTKIQSARDQLKAALGQ
jgi:hypothetical protein